jgi:hypothetical protein
MEAAAFGVVFEFTDEVLVFHDVHGMTPALARKERRSLTAALGMASVT